MLKKDDIAELVGRVRGTVCTEADLDYEAARASWNGRIDRRPAVIVCAADTSDVVAAIDFARIHDLTFAVKSTGHHVLGHGIVHQGLVLDVSALKQIEIDPVACTATIEPGVTVGEFLEAVQAAGFIGTVGSHSSVGMTGLTLGGGIGILMAKYGLASDNILSAEIVSADGRVHIASESKNPDLFWAIRGGGGNFGVVTRLTFRIHHAEPVVAGILVHPMGRAADVLRFYRDFTKTCPDELSVFAVLRTGPGGHPICGLLVCYTGPVDQGLALVKPITDYGPPIVNMVQPMPYAGLLKALDGQDPPGAHYAFNSCGVAELTDDVIDIVTRFATTRTSDATAIVIYHQHGLASRLPIDSTAYAARHIPYAVGMFAGWTDGDPSSHTEWLTGFSTALGPHARMGCSVNFLGDEGDDAVRAAYAHNYGRLAEVKRVWDPTNFFSHNHNVAPAK